MAAGVNAMDLRRGITMAIDSVVSTLKSRARMISTSEEIAQVCTNDLSRTFVSQKYQDVSTFLFFLKGWNNIGKWRARDRRANS